MIYKTHLEISKIVDGDGLIVKEIQSGNEIEIRLYGIDAPEIKRCSKLIQDERETHIAGALLIQLGLKSTTFLRENATVGSSCTLLQEPGNTIDIYGRTLAYLILADGTCLNELMVRNGYAKPYDKVFCEKLPDYQALNLIAMKNKSGLYDLVPTF
ncbi:MAG: thermonuclease family protein [Bacteroidales bacterium]